MGCGRSKPHDITSGKSLSKSRRAAKSLRSSLSRNTTTTTTTNNANANANPTTVNMAAAAAATDPDQNYAKGKAPLVEEPAAADTVVYDTIPDEPNDPVLEQEQPPLAKEESPAVSFSKVEESPAVPFSNAEEPPVVSFSEAEEPPMPSDTKPEEESPVYTVDLDGTKSGESPVFALIPDTKLEEPKDQSPPAENDHHHVTKKPEAESPVYTVVSDSNSEESPARALVPDTKPEETFVMPNGVDQAKDVVTTEPETEKKPPAAEDDGHVNNVNNISSNDHDHESPAHDFILASETTPEGSPTAAAAEEEETAHEFDDAQTNKILAMNEEGKEEDTNVVKDDEQQETTPAEVKDMKSDDPFEKGIKEKTLVAEHGGNGNDGES